MKPILILVLWTLFSPVGGSAAYSAITPAAGASRHVVLLGIDGFRADSLVEAETPHLDAIMKSGAYTLKAVSSTGQATSSGPSWSSILTGVWFNKHGVRNNEFVGQRFADYPSFLVRVENHLPGAITASIVNWAPINEHIPNRADVEKRGLPDAEVTAEAARLIVEKGPRAFFLQLDELDGAGHRGGYHPGNPDYLAMVATVDRYVGAILAAVADRKTAHPNEEWLLILVSDHGGTPDGKHGGQSPDEVIVPFLMTGDGVAPGQLMSKVFNVDAPVTALAWLGIAVDPAWDLDGRPQGLAAPAPHDGYPPTVTLEEVRERLDQARTPHPRLLTSQAELQAIRRSLDKDPLRRQLADTVIRQADLMLDVPPITRTLQGRRLLGQSRTCVQRVITLAMAFHLTEDLRYAMRAQNEMLAAARFEDWNPSHFLDVAEMTFALAIGYDWLFDQLDDAARIEIGDAIIQKGVSLPFTTSHNGWVRSSNNWGQVCHGGLTAGALAVMEREPELAARTVHSAAQNVTHSMAAFDPNGSYPEGPAYWAYGTGYNVLLIAVLESALGTDFGLAKAPGFDQTGQYPSLVGGPSGAYFNYADGGSGRGPEPFLFWFADRYERPDWLLGEHGRFHESLTRMARTPSASMGDRFLPLTLLWLATTPEPTEILMPLHWASDGETPITVHRSSWTDPSATFVGFKGGSPSANHGQMDIGSFVLDADGVRWAIDLGAENYHGIEARGMNLWDRGQASDRWTIFRQSNHGHNTLVIDGKPQQAAAAGRFLSFSDDPAFPHSVLDMTAVYAGQVGSAHRGIALLPSREVLIQDRLTGLQPGSRVRWGMISPGLPGDLNAAQVQLSQGDARLIMTIVSPSDAAWEVMNTAKPRNEWDSPNRGTRMLMFEVEAPESGELTLAVVATPGSCQTSMRSQPIVRPLTEWGR